MAQPTTKTELKDYCLRRLGAPVLEINVDDDQIDDLIDDAIQLFQERHFDGVERMFLKHKLTASDVAKFRGLDQEQLLGTATGAVLTVKVVEQGTGYTTGTTAAYTGGTGTSATFDITAKDGQITEVEISAGGTNYLVEDEITFTGGGGNAKIEVTGVQEQTEWEERDNFLPIPPQVLGVNRVFGVKGSNIRSNLFGLEYQLFLNDLYQFGSVDILSYFMTKTYLETLDMVLNNGAFIPFRFNRRADRLYIDTDRLMLDEGSYLIIDCHRLLDPQTYTEIYNDPFLKKYTTALIKRQWGQNLIKFKGAQLPGGITMNGRELYDDGNSEVMKIEDEITSTYELPPNWEIG